MLLSEIQKKARDFDFIEIRNEKPFSRFSRTTSACNESVCVFVGARKFVKTIPHNATMIITTSDIATEINTSHCGICISKNPKATYFRFFSAAYENQEKRKKVIGDECCISSTASICDYNVIIGNNVAIEDFVTIYGNVEIRDNCIIRSGARIGVQDYNYVSDDGRLIHIPHYGKLILEDSVEIGYNSVIGKSLYPEDKTVIGKDTKIGNCCAIGHDSIIGNRVMIYAGAMIAGHVSVGDNTHITLNSTVKNGIKIGNNAQINMGSVVIRDVSDGETVFGNPARKIIAPGE